MKKKPKMGRPKLPREDVRGVYPLRLSKSELERFHAAADKAELTLPEWIRTTLTAAS
jgi:hypothetical protein